MKKVIARKLYDTETAEEIATWSSPHYSSDFAHCTETLYRAKNGALFLYGQGGAMSRWSESATGGGTGGGSDILPLTREEALDWLEEHDLHEVIQKHFADAVQEA